MQLQLLGRGRNCYVVQRTRRARLTNHLENTFASICVTCPHRETGLCGTLLESEASRQPSWQHFVAARAGEQIVVRNQPYDDLFVLCAGWAFRYFQLSDGRRQILKFLLPGDAFSSVAAFEKSLPFSVKALTEVQLSKFVRSEIRAKCAANPDVQSALASSCVADLRDDTDLLTSLGQRSAEERIAHLLLHLMPRIAARNVIREQRYPFPLRQQHIADAVGLTPVHVSRVLSLFRDRRLVALSEGALTVFNLPELERIGTLR